MLVSKLRTVIAVGCCTVAVGAVSGGPPSTPASDVLATTLAAGTSSGDIRITAHGPTEVTVREITIEPGGSTGWHHHTGELLAAVQAPPLIRVLEDRPVVV